MSGKTYRELVNDALAAERTGRWGDARAAWDAARRASKTKKTRAEAAGKVAEMSVRAEAPPRLSVTAAKVAELERLEAEALETPPPDVAETVRPAAPELADALEAEARDARAVAAGLEPGDVVRHMRRGRTLASCEYRGDHDWVYDGESYTSCSAAANAAAARLGMKSATLNGWLFWGLEKRVRR